MTDENRVVLTKLALDRCLSHLSHMHAIFYLSGPRDSDVGGRGNDGVDGGVGGGGVGGGGGFGAGVDGVTVQNLFSLIESMRRELELSQNNLQLPVDDKTDDASGDFFVTADTHTARNAGVLKN